LTSSVWLGDIVVAVRSHGDELHEAVSESTTDDAANQEPSAAGPQPKIGISRAKSAKAAKEKYFSELGVLGVPSAQLRTCLARGISESEPLRLSKNLRKMAGKDNATRRVVGGAR